MHANRNDNFSDTIERVINITLDERMDGSFDDLVDVRRAPNYVTLLSTSKTS